MKQTNVAPKLQCEKFFNFFPLDVFIWKHAKLGSLFALSYNGWCFTLDATGCSIFLLLLFYFTLSSTLSLTHIQSYFLVSYDFPFYYYYYYSVSFPCFSWLFYSLLTDFLPLLCGHVQVKKLIFFPSRLIQNRKLSLVRCC